MNTGNMIAIKKMVALYNMIANLFWSILNLAPVSVFCYGKMSSQLFYILLSITIPTTLLPKSFFNYIQLSNTTSMYKKLGVKFVNRFTQNGDIINRLIRRKFRHYKVISNSNVSVNRLLQQTYVFEKFHFTLFVFFTLVTIYAFVLQLFWWGLIILISNIIYNVYPSLLQQYVRIKVTRLRDR